MVGYLRWVLVGNALGSCVKGREFSPSRYASSFDMTSNVEYDHALTLIDESCELTSEISAVIRAIKPYAFAHENTVRLPSLLA